MNQPALPPVPVPAYFDYAAVYLTQRCHLACEYCITEHNDSGFLTSSTQGNRLSADQWACGLNRLELPAGVPVTFQGGEPFLFKGIFELIELVRHPIDILTALPPVVTAERFRSLSRLDALNRDAPYPNIRVSFHPGQNKIEDLIPRVREIQEHVRIGIYMVAHPANLPELARAERLCRDAGVFFKPKEFLGYHAGRLHGTYLYPDAAAGRVTRPLVWCKNSVIILHPNGTMFHCHSDLYHRRWDLAVGNILDPALAIPTSHRPCQYYGLCSECDVKIKTNHNQVFGYTSANIRFDDPSESRTPSVATATA